MMKKVNAGLVALLAVTLSGCATMGGIVGIASEEYVDAQIAAAKTEIESEVQLNKASVDEVAADVEELSSEISMLVETAARVEDALTAVDEAVATTEELKQLADILEERLNTLPEETIRRLIQILQDHLDGA